MSWSVEAASDHRDQTFLYLAVGPETAADQSVGFRGVIVQREDGRAGVVAQEA
ncbi:hypothetical protein [Bacteroides thetaiotaomicron]|uniref:hypothetical protein n=1 Tax=Bacteroides thetaiotaomicron TaxID=818 RepID=UPI00232E4BA0|nr:hypothetical protein [Bacteroides thetaiotaomicron]